MTEQLRHLKYAKYLTFALAVCTIVSNVGYLVYLGSHHMARYWSGVNSISLGLFMAAWSAFLTLRGARWAGGVIAVIGLLNLVTGALFFF